MLVSMEESEYKTLQVLKSKVISGNKCKKDNKAHGCDGRSWAGAGLLWVGEGIWGWGVTSEMRSGCCKVAAWKC